jgi:Fe-S-cluster containining protein
MNIKDKDRLKPLYRFLNKIERDRPRGLQQIAVEAETTAWEAVDCLTCANCCKTMKPTYTRADINRISDYLKMSPGEFKKRWLRKGPGVNTWINKTTPCQFLDLKTNMCNVYEVRPADCSGFPHLTKKRVIDYLHVHKQNLDECPATFKMVERMKELMGERTNN